MLGRVGVGKGLNIKGKSAQKNRLSGFVPFLQITDNEHKKEVLAARARSDPATPGPPLLLIADLATPGPTLLLMLTTLPSLLTLPWRRALR
jgi:hypothetical protein